MPDWAIVLVAAFGGGLAGAVLQPVVIYILDRVRSAEHIRKERERHLRRMVIAQLRVGRKRIAAEEYIGHRLGLGVPLSPQEMLDHLAVPLDQKRPLFEPERICDTDLRGWITKYADASHHLSLLLFDESPSAKTSHLVRQLEELQQQITLRMDELNWPEVDD